ncbi:MAG: DUF2461 domain-containing protein [bacterium]|nr:DUF2461 domain-containing protein [bacterium]
MANAAGRFAGFPSEAFEFYDVLSVNNTRPWWNEHKAEYQRVVREPLDDLLAELSDEFGTPHVFRPYRDARFSKDKTPIKDHQGAVVQVEDAIVYYVQISSAGLMVAGGWYAPQGQQTARYRESVDGPVGSELERIVASLGRRFTVQGNPVKTKPRGYEIDNPRIGLLRNRQLTAGRTYEVDASLGTRKALATVRSDWRALRPLVEWLADYVGPATDPSLDD